VFAITFAASRHAAAPAITAATTGWSSGFAGLRSPWLTRVVRGVVVDEAEQGRAAGVPPRQAEE